MHCYMPGACALKVQHTLPGLQGFVPELRAPARMCGSDVITAQANRIGGAREGLRYKWSISCVMHTSTLGHCLAGFFFSATAVVYNCFNC